MTDKEKEIVSIWTLIGVFVGLMLTPRHYVYPVKPLVLGAFGAGVGLLLVLRLRWYRRQ